MDKITDTDKKMEVANLREDTYKLLEQIEVGAVKGDIDVHGPVIIDSSAIISGDIKSKSVQINNGATIDGRCSQCYADVNMESIFDIKGKKNK